MKPLPATGNTCNVCNADNIKAGRRVNAPGTDKEGELHVSVSL
jgi:hypothetical protein